MISNVNPSNDGFFVPLIYANLKSYCEQFPDIASQCNWIEPIFLPHTFEKLAEIVNLAKVSVLGISCYQWNYTYQYRLAKYLKTINPKCIIVAGGPQVEFRDPNFFEKNMFIDFVIPYEGEIPFKDILQSLIRNNNDFTSVTGAFINPKWGEFKFQNSEKLDLITRPSPWLTQKEFWVNFFKKYSHYRLATSYESARGCPYFCTFCDWGSDTNSKMRIVSTEIAEKELSFILRELKPPFIFWTDSNLGMIERDVNLVKYFADTRLESGYPRYLYYSNNKNSYTKNLEIAKEFRRANLIAKYTLSLQHTDKDVLAAVKRKNLPDDQISKLVSELYKIDYPIFLQLIIGCPGNTYEKWLNCFGDLMEIGVHSEYRIYPFNLLPNAPAADQKYIDDWKIETIERTDFHTYYQTKDKDLNWALSKSEYVVGSSTFSKSEYSKMQLLAWIIQAFHDHGFTRYLAIAMRRINNVKYAEFYQIMYQLFYETDELKEISCLMKNHIESWLTKEDSHALIKYDKINGYIEPEDFLVFQIYKNFDLFYDKINSELKKHFFIPDDLMDFQKKILFRPEHSPISDNLINLNSSWVNFFKDKTSDFSSEVGCKQTAYTIEMSNLVFQQDLWFKSERDFEKTVRFHHQMVQHNLPSSERAVFKRILELKS